MNPVPIALLRAAATGGEHTVRAALLVAVNDDGTLTVDLGGASPVRTQWLQTAGQGDIALAPGDTLAVVELAGAGWLALGRIGRYVAPRVPDSLVLRASQSVELTCGDTRLELRADGQVLLKGDDVLIRAKGTQRIRAGNVAIN